MPSDRSHHTRSCESGPRAADRCRTVARNEEEATKWSARRAAVSRSEQTRRLGLRQTTSRPRPPPPPPPGWTPDIYKRLGSKQSSPGDAGMEGYCSSGGDGGPAARAGTAGRPAKASAEGQPSGRVGADRGTPGRPAPAQAAPSQRQAARADRYLSVRFSLPINLYIPLHMIYLSMIYLDMVRRVTICPPIDPYIAYTRPSVNLYIAYTCRFFHRHLACIYLSIDSERRPEPEWVHAYLSIIQQIRHSSI